MKKGLIGCLVVGLLLVIVGGGAAYWFVLRPMYNSASAGIESVQQLAKVAEVQTQVKNQQAFTAPADGRLTAAEVATFVAIESGVESKMGGEMDAMKAKYEAMDKDMKAQGREANAGEAMGAMADFSSLLAKARTAQVDELNKAGMSMEEFSWVRAQAMSSLPLASMDKIPDGVANPAQIANADLLRPHKDVLNKAMGRAWLGF